MTEYKIFMGRSVGKRLLERLRRQEYKLKCDLKKGCVARHVCSWFLLPQGRLV
jgi:hypothetical protein